MIIWCMLPEIWSATNKNFCHFGSLFALSPPTNNPIYWKLEKCKKTLEGDIFLLHMCAINKCYVMYGSWGIRHNRQSFLSFSAICCPFTPFFPFDPLNNLKNQNFEKWKKDLEILLFYTCTINDNQMVYGSCIWSATEFFCHFQLFVVLLPTLTTCKIKIWKKWKKCLEIIILFKCTINDNHMMYGSWDMKQDRQNFLSFRAIFCSFTSLTTPKIKLLKKLKQKRMEISPFCTNAPKIMIICFTVPKIWHMTDVIFIFHFRLLFALLIP